MYKPALVAGTIIGLLAVIIGAFGAHGVKDMVTADQVVIYQKGVEYQFYHAFALLATGILYSAFPFKIMRSAYLFFLIGIICFSGSLYLLVGLNYLGRNLGPVGIITPFGGLFFIAGWAALLTGILKKN